MDNTIQLMYTNYKGVTSTRTVFPIKVYYGETEHHPIKQHILQVYDVDKGELRDYALADCDFTRRKK